MKKIGVLLAGCGVYDGAEIHESVITLLAIDRQGAEAVPIAPEMEQFHVIDHATGQPADERRNVRTEAARIARGEVQDAAKVNVDDLDALIIPGGFGAAKNLCDFAVKNTDCTANADVAALIKKVHGAGKPIGALCIAPALMARVLGGEVDGLELTIGNDAGTAEALRKMGVEHVDCDVRDCHVDGKNKVVSTPAYMLAGRISEAADGIEKLVGEVLKLA